MTVVEQWNNVFSQMKTISGETARTEFFKGIELQFWMKHGLLNNRLATERKKEEVS